MYEQLKQMADLLGWDDLQKRRHEMPSEAVAEEIVWYETAPLVKGVYLQINVIPDLRAAVYAIRYRICSGWHQFELCDDSEKLELEAQRLGTWCHRSWFESVARRRQYRQLHPECSNWTWKRVREERPPCFPRLRAS